MNQLLYEKESFEIRGACFNVYNSLGGGIKEKMIERALCKELSLRGMIIENQVRIDVIYADEKIGTYIPDIIVNDKIMIETKSKPSLITEDKKQFWGYLKGSKYQLGFLVNFSPERFLRLNI